MTFDEPEGADCVFIQEKVPTTACEVYKSKLANGRIGVSSHMPSAIVSRTANEKIQRLMKVLELAEEALQEVWSMCSHEHWLKVGEALERISEVMKNKC